MDIVIDTGIPKKLSIKVPVKYFGNIHSEFNEFIQN